MKDNIDVQMVDSDFYVYTVYTRLDVRDVFSTQDQENQLATFHDILNRITP